MAAKNLQAFETLFRQLFKPLCGFAMKYVRDLDEAKGIVHDVFIQLWEKFDQLPEDSNYRGYLFTAVRNRCLNHLRDRKKFSSLSDAPEGARIEENRSMEAAELEREIEVAINMLPERCRLVFEMNRQDGLSYIQVAEKLGISVKTVEAQMSKALALLRERLGEFLVLIIFMSS
ncbi:MAG: RNA polymerase sigma-70 factor [Cyclobacteriaceae bacterium]|nr:RNA polymerase sigma-70 factor [Cyclobacteriaceae bacterium]